MIAFREIIIFTFFGSVMAAPVREEMHGNAWEIIMIMAVLSTMTVVIALGGICQCPQKIDQKQFSYTKERSNMNDAEYFASFSKKKGQTIVRMESVNIETFPMLTSHRAC